MRDAWQRVSVAAPLDSSWIATRGDAGCMLTVEPLVTDLVVSVRMAVRLPEAMNEIVATMDRLLMRALPQIPDGAALSWISDSNW